MVWPLEEHLQTWRGLTGDEDEAAQTLLRGSPYCWVAFLIREQTDFDVGGWWRESTIRFGSIVSALHEEVDNDRALLGGGSEYKHNKGV